MQISREELIHELQEERQLRSLIRRGIKHVMQKKHLEEKQYKKDEQKLREILKPEPYTEEETEEQKQNLDTLRSLFKN